MLRTRSICSKLALSIRNVPYLEDLLKHNCAIDVVDTETKETALHVACKKNDLWFVTVLVERGASVDSLNRYKWKPEKCASARPVLRFFHLLAKQKSEVKEDVSSSS
jgi:ankyrin repeat protein